jgi:hypothetical protein
MTNEQIKTQLKETISSVQKFYGFSENQAKSYVKGLFTRKKFERLHWKQKVKVVETGIIYDSVEDCSCAIDVSGYCIRRACNLGCSYKGYHFVFCRETKSNIKTTQSKTNKEIDSRVCQISPESLEVIKVYEDINTSATSVKRSRANVWYSIRHGTLCAGFFWCFFVDKTKFIQSKSTKEEIVESNKQEESNEIIKIKENNMEQNLLENKEENIPAPPISMNDISLEFVTPEKAKMYLSSQRENRNKKPRNMNKLINDMVSGKYFVNGSTLVFDKHGRLGDGQHRCTAVIESQRGQWFIIVKNIPDEAFDTIDTGSARTAGDVLMFAGIKFYNKKAAIVSAHNSIKFKKLAEGGNSSWSKTGGKCIDLSPLAIKEQYLNNQQLYDFCYQLGSKCYYKNRKLLPLSILGGTIAYLINDKGHTQDVVEDFFTRLFISRDGGMNVINLMKDKLEKERDKITKKGPLHMYALLTKCWNCYVSKKDAKQLSYNKEHEGVIVFL